MTAIVSGTPTDPKDLETKLHEATDWLNSAKAQSAIDQVVQKAKLEEYSRPMETYIAMLKQLMQK